MKNLILFIIAGFLFASCGTQKALKHEKTLAQLCKDRFPCKEQTLRIDTVWRVQPIETKKIDTVILDTVRCPMDAEGMQVLIESYDAKIDSLKKQIVIPRKKKITVPPRTQKIKVPCPDTVRTVIDSSCYFAYKDLEMQYTEMELEMNVYKAKYEEAKKKGIPWLPWVLVILLLGVLAFAMWLNRI